MENYLYIIGSSNHFVHMLWIVVVLPVYFLSCYIIGVYSEIKFNLLFSKDGLGKYISRFIMGWIVEIVFFQLICIPMIICNAKFTTLAMSFVILIFAICIIALLKYKIFKNIKDTVKKIINDFFELYKNNKSIFIYGVIVLILISMQVLIGVIGYQGAEDEIMDYTVAAQTLNNNTMFRTQRYTGYECGLQDASSRFICSWYMYRPFLALILQVHPTILGRTILIPILFIFTYMCYYLFAKTVLNDKEKITLFMLFLCIVNLFGNIRITSMLMMFTQIGNGKSIFSNILIPLYFLLFFRLYESEEKSIYKILAILNICSVAMAPTSLIYSALIALLGTVVIAWRKKKLKIFINTLITILPNVIYFGIYLIEARWAIW